MINRRAKGNEIERRARQYLERLGYLVHRAQQSGFMAGGKWLARTNDVWNVFDLLAMAADRKLLAVQVTSSPGDVAAKRRQLLELATHYPLEHMDVELWWYYGNQPAKGSPLRQQWKAERLVRRPDVGSTPCYAWESLGFIDMEGETDGEGEEVHEGAEGEESEAAQELRRHDRGGEARAQGQAEAAAARGAARR